MRTHVRADHNMMITGVRCYDWNIFLCWSLSSVRLDWSLRCEAMSHICRPVTTLHSLQTLHTVPPSSFMCEPSQKISGYFLGKSTTGYINGAFSCKELIFKLLTSDMLMESRVSWWPWLVSWWLVMTMIMCCEWMWFVPDRISTYVWTRSGISLALI